MFKCCSSVIYVQELFLSNKIKNKSIILQQYINLYNKYIPTRNTLYFSDLSFLIFTAV